MKIPIAASSGVSIISVGIFNAIWPLPNAQLALPICVRWVSAQYKLEVAASGRVSDPANK